MNRLVRAHRDDVERFLQAAATLRDLQFSGKSDLSAATKQEREALERLVGLGGEAVRPTLLAAAVDDDAAQQLLAARLEQGLDPGGFGTLLAHAPLKAAHGKATTSTAKKPVSAPEEKPDDAPARARLEEAKAELRAAEDDERRLRSQWRQSQRRLEEARKAVEKARHDLDQLRSG